MIVIDSLDMSNRVCIYIYICNTDIQVVPTLYTRMTAFVFSCDHSNDNGTDSPDSPDNPNNPNSPNITM